MIIGAQTTNADAEEDQHRAAPPAPVVAAAVAHQRHDGDEDDDGDHGDGIEVVGVEAKAEEEAGTRRTTDRIVACSCRRSRQSSTASVIVPYEIDQWATRL